MTERGGIRPTDQCDLLQHLFTPRQCLFDAIHTDFEETDTALPVRINESPVALCDTGITFRYEKERCQRKNQTQSPDGLIKEMRMPPSSGILMVYDNKKPDWRRRHYVIRPVVPLAEKSTVARPTSPHHDHLDAGWSDALQIHSSSAVVLFSSLRKPDKRKARNGGSSAPSFSRRFQEQRSFKLF